jgi:hypothetical protein
MLMIRPPPPCRIISIAAVCRQKKYNAASSLRSTSTATAHKANHSARVASTRSHIGIAGGSSSWTCLSLDGRPPSTSARRSATRGRLASSVRRA